mmetsp:Transcript_2947/g.2962  ORF Transcript_2947/g.2962 Transcript_2947/m.2962 type:complete len:83 (+) Transcript_2947:385-633(+)
MDGSLVKVGIADGIKLVDGYTEGVIVLEAVGTVVGFSEGALVAGCCEGAFVGMKLVGNLVGVSDEILVGFRDGETVVGIFVG